MNKICKLGFCILMLILLAGTVFGATQEELEKKFLEELLKELKEMAKLDAPIAEPPVALPATPATPTTPPPVGQPQAKPGGVNWGLIMVLVVLFVLAIVFVPKMLYRRRKKKKRDTAADTTAAAGTAAANEEFKLAEIFKKKKEIVEKLIRDYTVFEKTADAEIKKDIANILYTKNKKQILEFYNSINNVVIINKKLYDVTLELSKITEDEKKMLINVYNEQEVGDSKVNELLGQHSELVNSTADKYNALSTEKKKRIRQELWVIDKIETLMKQLREVLAEEKKLTDTITFDIEEVNKRLGSSGNMSMAKIALEVKEAILNIHKLISTIKTKEFPIYEEFKKDAVLGNRIMGLFKSLSCELDKIKTEEINKRLIQSWVNILKSDYNLKKYYDASVLQQILDTITTNYEFKLTELVDSGDNVLKDKIIKAGLWYYKITSVTDNSLNICYRTYNNLDDVTEKTLNGVPAKELKTKLEAENVKRAGGEDITPTS